MRISDWSSDVCSSDLAIETIHAGYWQFLRDLSKIASALNHPQPTLDHAFARRRLTIGCSHYRKIRSSDNGQARRNLPAAPASRSEEHTSDIQSLMLISSAVFCLKKKNY